MIKRILCTFVIALTILNICSCSKPDDEAGVSIDTGIQTEQSNDIPKTDSEIETETVTETQTDQQQNNTNEPASVNELSAFDLDENIEKYEYTYTLDTDKPENKAYAEFVKGLTDIHGYAVKDLNGDGILELIVKKPEVAITVYSYNGKVFETGSYEFYTGTLRLLCSKDYPGLIAFTVGGGANLYRYVTVKNGELVLEDIWKDYYSYDGVVVTKRNEVFTDNNDLIKQSAIAYNNDQDLNFILSE